jgi:hypothetical protein
LRKEAASGGRLLISVLGVTRMFQFQSLDPGIQAALIGAGAGLLAGFVGPLVKHILDRRAMRRNLEDQYIHDEQKKLRQLIGEHHGRILYEADRLTSRLWNLQSNQSKGWLDLEGDYTSPRERYYFTSMVEMFLALFVRIRKFQHEVLYIDARKGTARDVLFYSFSNALKSSVTDVGLFRGLEYDDYHARDHFFSGQLDVACDYCFSNEEPWSLKDFERAMQDKTPDEALQPVLSFFDGLKRDEERYRWDRIVALHILLVLFLEEFGYPTQKIQRGTINELLEKFDNVSVAQETKRLVVQFQLEQSKTVRQVLNRWAIAK